MYRAFIAVMLSVSAAHASPIGAVDKILASRSGERGPGCAVAIMRPGSPLIVRAFGLANVENNVPSTAATVFNIGSIGKQFTAYAVLSLVEQGRVKLTDDVRDYLPEFPATARVITVDDLLHQTSGLRDAYELLKMAGWQIYDDLITNDDIDAVAARQREDNFAAGDEYSYSNTNYVLLGRIIERASGEKLASFLDRLIFRPLGMAHTLVRDDRGTIIPRCATSYFRDRNGALAMSSSNDEVTGDGNVFTTVADFARWMRHLDSGTLGQSKLLDVMAVPGSLNDGSTTEYGRGLRLGRYGGFAAVEHGGADAGYHSYFILIPEKHLAVAAFCNVRDARSATSPATLARRLIEVFLPPVREPARRDTVTPSPGIPNSLERYTGSYFNPKDGSVIAIGMNGARLFMVEDFASNARLPVTTSGSNTWSVGDDTLRFTVGENGVAMSLSRIANSTTARYERVSDVSEGGDIHRFAGTYRSAEAATDWIIEQRDQSLWLRIPRHRSEQLVQVFANGFYADQWTLVFEGNELMVTNERARAVRFSRAR